MATVALFAEVTLLQLNRLNKRGKTCSAAPVGQEFKTNPCILQNGLTGKCWIGITRVHLEVSLWSHEGKKMGLYPFPTVRPGTLQPVSDCPKSKLIKLFIKNITFSPNRSRKDPDQHEASSRNSFPFQLCNKSLFTWMRQPVVCQVRNMTELKVVTTYVCRPL